MAQPGAGAAAPAAPAPVVAMNNAQLQQLAQLMRGASAKLRRMTSPTAAAWLEHKRHFRQVAELQDWGDQRQRQELLASIQEKAGNAVMDLQIANFATIALLQDAVEARFMPAAAGATARSNYQGAKQLPMESSREWHTRVRELFFLAYPNEDPNAQNHCLDLFVNGIYNGNVRFFVASQNLANFTDALPVAERAETAHRDINGPTTQAAGTHAITTGVHAMNLGGNPAPLACYFCADAFKIQAPHTKNRCPYWKAARDAFNAQPPAAAGQQQQQQQQQQGQSGRGRNRRGGRGSRGGNKAGRAVNSVHPEPAHTSTADSSDEEQGN